MYTPSTTGTTSIAWPGGINHDFALHISSSALSLARRMDRVPDGIYLVEVRKRGGATWGIAISEGDDLLD